MTLPVVYPKIERTWEMNGPKIAAVVSTILPKIVSRFIPKNDKINNANSINIMS
jgi:hypothetical protein